MSEGLSASDSSRRTRVLVFIVAYRAEKHIAGVLSRIPAAVWDDPDVHVLMIDDASSDASASAAREWVQANHPDQVTVLRNPVNQGYGGNQKLGYRIAIDAGYDFVILLHGDGQYAPELLPQFIETYRSSHADVVLGSRMTDVKRARAGGMPWYKVIGNRALTKFQNAMTGRKLSEYHTGYRGYSTKFLRSVPFEANTNAFHFDTEILLQAFHVGASVKEFDIPTHYGDEVCHVNGPRYAWDVVRATIQYRLHQKGMLCSLRYRNLSIERYRDKTSALYTSHRLAIDVLRKLKPKTVLDLGCGPGFVAQVLEREGMRVTGVDAYDPLPGMLSEFRKADLDKPPLPVDMFDYDAVLLLDVIEHLSDPEAFLVSLRNDSRATDSPRPAPTMVLSTPNIAFAAIRLNMLLGRFNYAERGILDITHKRLFTRKALRRTMEDCGYTIEKMVPIGPPFEIVMQGGMGRFLGAIAHFMARVWPGMFAFQLMLVCKPMPGVRQLLGQSERHFVPEAGNVVGRVLIGAVAGDEGTSISAK
ncbi:MAG: bifunctional glycosyltransferase/class I SAM-dependent methyltransferase [Tepidisphaeraceae bacterium]